MKPQIATNDTRTLSSRTASGVAWLVAQTLVIKLANFVGQIVLARLLVPEDFGLFAMCLAVMAFAGIIRTAGVTDVLIQRHRRFHLWSPVAFQLSVVTAVGAALLVVIASPLIGRAFDEPRLGPLLLIIAAEVLLTGLTIVPQAALLSQMRFKAIASVNTFLAIGQTLGQVGLAFAGLGVLGLLIPRLAIVLIRLVVWWQMSGPPIRGPVRFSRWAKLINDSAWVLGALMCFTLTQQGDYLLLGVLADATALGLYFFAFNLSIQAVTLLTSNLQTVLLPALSKLTREPKRQSDACVRAAHRFAIIAIPLSFAQAVIAVPLFSLLFDEQYLPAAHLYAILNLGMAFRLISPLGGNLLKAQRRFRVYFICHSTSAFAFLLMIASGWMLAGLVGVAAAVALHSAAALVLFFSSGLRSLSAGISVVLHITRAPLLASLLAAALGCLAMQQIDGEGSKLDLLRMLCALATGGVIYAGAIALLDRPAVEATIALIRGLMKGSSVSKDKRVVK